MAGNPDMTFAQLRRGPVILCLPWPPSVNHYWRVVENKVLISKAGRAYRKEVFWLTASFRAQFATGALSVAIASHPPDHRRRDIDNLFKAVLDALEHAFVYTDDVQIAHLSIERMPVCKRGKILVTISRLAEAEDSCSACEVIYQ